MCIDEQNIHIVAIPEVVMELRERFDLWDK
jgi:hypothetical protein